MLTEEKNNDILNGYMDLSPVAIGVSQIIDLLGIIAIVWGVLYALVDFIISYVRSGHMTIAYTLLRQHLARTILIGLELLIAGDIIRSTSTQASFSSVAVLAVIVIIRTFLASQVEKETTWHIPWKKMK